MSHVPHELAEDFPGQVDKIHELKVANGHFAKLMEEYHEINREVHRAETNVAPVAELTEVDMRKRRAALKDEIARILAQS